MALTTESHRLRVRAGSIPMDQLGTGDLCLDLAPAKAVPQVFTTICHGKAGKCARTELKSDSSMGLKSLLLSSDEKTVRVLRRVLSDLEIGVEHCTAVDEAIRRITRQRFEAI